MYFGLNARESRKRSKKIFALGTCAALGGINGLRDLFGLDEVLKRITEFYAREIDNTVANLMVLMEPAIMILMGIAVGIMVAAIILPMYQMASGY